MSNHFEIRREVVLDATPEQVWQAIATPAGRTAWSPDPYGTYDGLEVDEQPPSRLEVRTPAAPDGAFHAFEYVIEARDDTTTVLRFVHSGFLGDDWDAEFNYEDLTARGWDMYLHTLGQYLRYFDARPATYVEAQGPESSSSPDAWRLLEQALGIDVPPALGAAVSLTPTGLAAIEGVVDYVEPGEGGFLAVRTDDGLYRFHDMATMGMPVTVGHYLYRDVDRAEEERAWADWLAEVYA